MHLLVAVVYIKEEFNVFKCFGDLVDAAHVPLPEKQKWLMQHGHTVCKSMIS